MTKEELSELKSRVKRIAVEQLLDDEKTVVDEFKSMKDAAKAMKVHLSAISLAIKHNFNCKGFRWRKKLIEVPITKLPYGYVGSLWGTVSGN